MDRLKTMESFVRVARSGSFAAAATQLGVSRAIVSKHVQSLETYVGARLFHRTTRRVGLTAAGAEHYAFCLRVLEELQAQRHSLSRMQREPSGTIRVMAPKSFGNLYLGPAVADFVAGCPDLHVDLMLSDDSLNAYDLIENGFDLAVRLSPAPESSVIARRIGALRWIVCASPEYLTRHGSPKTPQALTRHNCLVHLRTTPDCVWRLASDKGDVAVKVSGSLSSNSSLALSSGALNGLGVALLPAYCIRPYLDDGRLVELLPDHRFPDRPIFALYPDRRNVPHAVRMLIDFLTERLAQSGLNEQAAQAVTKEPAVPCLS